MSEALVLDVLLGLTLIAYVAYGLRNGLSRSLFVIAGVVAGAIAAFFLAPLVSTWVPFPFLRVVATILVAVGLLAAGHALGALIGRAIRRGIERSPLSGFDRFLGGVVTGIAAALVASVVATSVASLGVPLLSRAIAGSVVLRTINGLTPDPVEAYLAQVRAYVIDQGLPIISGALGTTPVIPDIDTGSDSLNTAAASVVRITGNALACGVSQAGTGFVVADDRIVTNAHVVAGVTEPVVEAPDGQTLQGSVVYFDPIGDLAVIHSPGLDAAPLPLGETLPVGADAAIEGYPYGGPFSAGPASVMSIGTATVADIYGRTGSAREVYTLAADVRQGNSGGPLLSLDGVVVGVVFAKSGDTANVGYAMTMSELDPVVDQASTLTSAVSSGECTG
ncbi:MAG: MarP family serine protease [Microbacteriaceae bacterium]|nr:MarP family serine protease [Microbacteriaceae bacterium]